MYSAKGIKICLNSVIQYVKSAKCYNLYNLKRTIEFSTNTFIIISDLNVIILIN